MLHFRYFYRSISLLSAVFFLSISLAHAAVSPTADRVSLLKSCNTLDDCFTTWDALSSWIGSTRNPTESTPLVVSIGPGEFVDTTTVAGQTSTSMLLDCAATPTTGWIKFRGAGREQTRLVGRVQMSAFWIEGCEALEFQDLSIEGEIEGVGWNKSGTSTWTNVDFYAGDLAWADYCDSQADAAWIYWGGKFDIPDTGRSEHYFFNTRLKTGTFSSYCATNWIYASDFAKSVTSVETRRETMFAAFFGDIRLFGSTVRVNSSAGDAGAITAIDVSGDGQLHMHGGIINVNTKAGTGNAIGIKMNTSALGKVHVIDTAFNMMSSLTAKTIRLENSGAGKVMSPFMWQPGEDAPGTDLMSITGQDTFVETDCDSTGDCSGSCVTNPDEVCQPHLMIYSTACDAISGTRWFDSTVNQCKP